MTLSADEIARKQAWRKSLLADRAAVGEARHARDAEALRTGLLAHLADIGARTVCAYVPVGSEPGSAEFLDAAREAGLRVLLPIVTGQQPLDWADYTGPDSLRTAAYGLSEPAGERFGAAGIGAADAVLVPALAVDRNGTRLGRGGGHYDRSLPLVSEGTRLIAVVRDPEFVDDLPGEAHDVLVHAVATPQRGVVALPV